LNRLQHALLHEAYYLIENGVATIKDVDEGAKYLLGPRMCISGLIQQKDISGFESMPRPKSRLSPTCSTIISRIPCCREWWPGVRPDSTPEMAFTIGRIAT
jgi:hypothetical protein